MSNRIKVEDIILQKLIKQMKVEHSPWKDFEEAWRALWMLYDPSPAKRVVKAAIKEIVEAVIDEISKGAKINILEHPQHGGMFKGTSTNCAVEVTEGYKTFTVDKDSILNFKKMIDYE